MTRLSEGMPTFEWNLVGAEIRLLLSPENAATAPAVVAYLRE